MKAAFLTSSLIASKGKAVPATQRATPQHLLEEDARQTAHPVSRIYQRVREYAEPEKIADTAPRTIDDQPPASDLPDQDFRNDPAFGGLDEATQSAVSREVTRTLAEQVRPASSPATAPSQLDEAAARKIAEEVESLKRDGLGRIRISVRMSPRDHLQLKLIAAHTQMSAQSIFETALEEYVANHGSEILPQSCSCVLDKSSL